MSPNEVGFIIVSLLVIVLAVASYIAVKIWGEKNSSPTLKILENNMECRHGHITLSQLRQHH